MNWWNKIGTVLMNNPILCVMLIVIFVGLYVALIVFEDKWGE